MVILAEMGEYPGSFLTIFMAYEIKPLFCDPAYAWATSAAKPIPAILINLCMPTIIVSILAMSSLLIILMAFLIFSGISRDLASPFPPDPSGRIPSNVSEWTRLWAT